MPVFCGDTNIEEGDLFLIIAYDKIFVNMIEENNIFLAGSDALVYLAEPMHKKYLTKLFCGNSFSTYVSYD